MGREIEANVLMTKLINFELLEAVEVLFEETSYRQASARIDTQRFGIKSRLRPFIWKAATNPTARLFASQRLHGLDIGCPACGYQRRQ